MTKDSLFDRITRELDSYFKREQDFDSELYPEIILDLGIHELVLNFVAVPKYSLFPEHDGEGLFTGNYYEACSGFEAVELENIAIFEDGFEVVGFNLSEDYLEDVDGDYRDIVQWLSEYNYKE